ncbi:MAG: ribosome-associated translation inhibitor RaiA [Chloroflexota bacterium]
MDIIFRGQHVTLTDEFRTQAETHLQKLERHLKTADHAIVDVRREAKGDDGRYVVQVTISANGTFLRAEERNKQLLTAIESASAVLDRQAKRYKERKLMRSGRRVAKEERIPNNSKSDESIEPRLPDDAEIIEGRVVRMKRFPLKPMGEAEAIDQMELLGHDFFLFRDADRDEVALLYRREDGDYGMILQENA